MRDGENKVAMLLPFFFPAFGGTELATYNLARELRYQALCDVKIWTLCKENRLYGREMVTKDSSGLGQAADVPILRYSAINLPKIEDFSIKLATDLNNSDENILHFQGAHRVLSRLLLMKTVRSKITVLTTHALQESASMVSRSRFRLLKNPLFVGSLKNLDHIIALSRTDLTLLTSMGLKRERITIIPNGIDETKFEKRRKYVNENGKLKILCVARFQCNKNYEALVQVIEKLAKTFDIEAYFIGIVANQQYFNKIIQLIKERNVDKIIKIGLALDNAALMDCYLSCDLFVLPSTSETSPIALLEAMYAGLPIVASSVGGIPDIVKNGVNGFLVSPDNIPQMYEQTARLLKNADLRIEIGMRNKVIAREFTWAKVAVATNRLYQTLVEMRETRARLC